MNSNNKNRKETLALSPGKKSEQFLIELANLRPERDSIERFNKHYGEIIHYLPPWKPTDDDLLKYGVSRKQVDEFAKRSALIAYREKLRRIWREPDSRGRLYGFFLLWRKDLIAIDSRFVRDWDYPPLPPPSDFERTLQPLLSKADFMVLCANPDCPAPYFFAERRGLKYCSPECALPAQQKFKREWWRKHGEEWRAKRIGKKRRKKGEKRDG